MPSDSKMTLAGAVPATISQKMQGSGTSVSTNRSPSPPGMRQRPYIATGAAIPSSASPFRSACAVAAVSPSRAVRVGSALGSTGQAW